MPRMPLATDIKTRTGAPEGKDARLKNAYVETRGEQSVVRKRLIAQGGIVVGSGVAQGGIDNDGVPFFTWGDNTPTPYTGGGTTWNSGTTYSVGDHVTQNFVDYWALTDNINQDPATNPDDWSNSYVPNVHVSVIYATWNPADTFATLVLSNGNLSVSDPGDNGGNSRATIGKSIGKWYWEITTTSSGLCFGLRVGVGTSAVLLSASVGNTIYGWAFNVGNASSNFIHNNVQTPAGSAYSSGVVISVLLDMDAGTIGFYQNGVNLGTAYSGLSGTVYPMVSPNFGTPTGLTTANFGTSAFAYSVPAGYNSGLYT